MNHIKETISCIFKVNIFHLKTKSSRKWISFSTNVPRVSLSRLQSSKVCCVIEYSSPNMKQFQENQWRTETTLGQKYIRTSLVALIVFLTKCWRQTEKSDRFGKLTNTWLVSCSFFKTFTKTKLVAPSWFLEVKKELIVNCSIRINLLEVGCKLKFWVAQIHSDKVDKRCWRWGNVSLISPSAFLALKSCPFSTTIHTLQIIIADLLDRELSRSSAPFEARCSANLPASATVAWLHQWKHTAHSLMNNSARYHMLLLLWSSSVTHISVQTHTHEGCLIKIQTRGASCEPPPRHMIGCWSASFHNLSGQTSWTNLRNLSHDFPVRCSFKCTWMCLTLWEVFPVFVSSLNLHSLGVLMDKWNNVRVWGRQSAFWEYLWCLAQHWPFLLLTASIHPQGQYAVLIAATHQKRWEISSGNRHTRTTPQKMFWYNDSQDTKMFAERLVCCCITRKPRQDFWEHWGQSLV